MNDGMNLVVRVSGNDDGRQLASAPTGPVNSGYGFVMNHLTAPTGVDVGHQTQTDQLMMANSNYYVPHQGSTDSIFEKKNSIFPYII